MSPKSKYSMEFKYKFKKLRTRMSKFTKKLKIKRKIREVFIPDVDPVKAAKKITDDDLVDMLNTVHEDIVNPNKRISGEIERLVYAGCVRFDRWFAPSPYVVKCEQKNRFKKFVAAMKYIEGTGPTNGPVFEIHALRDELYSVFGDVPFGSREHEKIDSFETRLSQIPLPPVGPKLKEYIEQKKKVELIIEGIRDGSLRTIMTFRVPYIIHKQNLQLSFTWREATARMDIQPTFKPLEESFMAVEGGVALSVGASRWQTGFSEIALELAVLMDGSAYSESLQSIPGHKLPVTGWPKSFTSAFEIFHDVAWNVRDQLGAHQDWIPAPRDISALTFSVGSAKEERIEWIVKGSPASLVETFSPTPDILEIELDELKPLSWDAECRSRAQMHLELGDTNEALFWVNVAVEALIASRFQEIEILVDKPGLADQLGSPKEFWADAEKIVTEQYPDMVGKVKWPSSQIHVSVFGKIKALYRLVPMRTSHKELLKQYRIISGERNDLFHGKRGGRTSVETVLKAFDALEWIRENMFPKTSS